VAVSVTVVDAFTTRTHHLECELRMDGAGATTWWCSVGKGPMEPTGIDGDRDLIAEHAPGGKLSASTELMIWFRTERGG
jgi:hypothetical protein